MQAHDRRTSWHPGFRVMDEVDTIRDRRPPCEGVMRKGFLFGIVVTASLLLSVSTRAQDVQIYPSKSIRFIVPVPAGGGVDTLARIVADVLRNRWGKPVIVENHSGAGGNIGAELVYRAEPDGYTLLFTAGGVLVTNKMLYSKLGFDPGSFVPISVVAASGSVLVVNPKVEAQNVQQLIGLAKANPDALDYASPGSGTGSHLTAEMFKSMAGIKITHVPYKGTSPALNDLLSGQVSLMFGELGSVLPHVRAGNLRALAVTGERRIPSLPDVPVMSEVLAGFVAAPWNGVVAPPNTPVAIANKISSTIADELKQPDVAKRLTDRNFEVVGSTPEEMAILMKQEIERWGTVIRALGGRAGLTTSD
jgi:tripartite-type tricarboxylate transporter receptor subunit TctC